MTQMSSDETEFNDQENTLARVSRRHELMLSEQDGIADGSTCTGTKLGTWSRAYELDPRSFAV